MRRVSILVFSMAFTVVLVGCAGRQTVRVPPRIDLTMHEMIGVVDFDSPSHEDLGVQATRRFTEAARRDQGLVRMVGFGSEEEALRAVHSTSWSPETVQALGQTYGVQTILRGKLTISKVRPDLKISPSLRSGSVTAQIDASLAVELIEASTGASLWTRSAKATRSVGQVGISGGLAAIDVEDPKRVYEPLIDELVGKLTRDFHATWERR